MVGQLKTTNGNSFWDLSHVCLEDLKYGQPKYHWTECWVRWEGRNWLCKRKEDALNEILGYQLAQLIGLPVQTWVAFFQTTKRGLENYPFLNGILVEHWPDAAESHTLHLTEPTDTHPDLVSKALAMSALDRGGDMEWLTDAGQNNLRLFDLETTGPKLAWPLNGRFVALFKRDAHLFYNQARDSAVEVRLEKGFDAWITKLLEYNFAGTFDFTGHPHEKEIGRLIARGFAAWQVNVRNNLRSRGGG